MNLACVKTWAGPGVSGRSSSRPASPCQSSSGSTIGWLARLGSQMPFNRTRPRMPGSTVLDAIEAPGLPDRLARSLVAHLRLPLFRNGYALLFGSAATSGLGLLYWVFAARFYPAELVGINSA